MFLNAVAPELLVPFGKFRQHDQISRCTLLVVFVFVCVFVHCPLPFYSVPRRVHVAVSLVMMMLMWLHWLLQSLFLFLSYSGGYCCGCGVDVADVAFLLKLLFSMLLLLLLLLLLRLLLLRLLMSLTVEVIIHKIGWCYSSCSQGCC